MKQLNDSVFYVKKILTLWFQQLKILMYKIKLIKSGLCPVWLTMHLDGSFEETGCGIWIGLDVPKLLGSALAHKCGGVWAIPVWFGQIFRYKKHGHEFCDILGPCDLAVGLSLQQVKYQHPNPLLPFWQKC